MSLLSYFPLDNLTLPKPDAPLLYLRPLLRLPINKCRQSGRARENVLSKYEFYFQGRSVRKVHRRGEGWDWKTSRWAVLRPRCATSPIIYMIHLSDDRHPWRVRLTSMMMTTTPKSQRVEALEWSLASGLYPQWERVTWSKWKQWAWICVNI